MIQRIEYVMLRQQECEHCSFIVHLPRLRLRRPILCPRCWRPFAEAEREDEQKPPTVYFKPARIETTDRNETPRETEVSTDRDLPVSRITVSTELNAQPQIEFVAVSVEADFSQEFEREEQASHRSEQTIPLNLDPVPELENHVLLQTEADQNTPLTHPEKLRRWFSSYGISLCAHALLLLLAALFVFQTEQFAWHEPVQASFIEHEDLVTIEEMVELELPVGFVEQSNILPLSEVKSVAELESSKVSLPEIDSLGFPDISFEGDNSGDGKSGTGRGRGKPGARSVGFFGTQARGNSFAFIVDVSGSMISPFSQQIGQNGLSTIAMNRWEKAREELLNAIDGMNPKQSFLVCLYNHQNYRFSPGSGRSKLIPATARNKRALRQWLFQGGPGGGTDPRQSITEALSSKPEVVFLLTDGLIPPESRSAAQLANKNEAIIHTTCIGSLENELLQQIAQDHRGQFRGIVGGPAMRGSFP